MDKKIVGVNFIHGRVPAGQEARTYYYFTDIEDLKEGDYTIVVVNEQPAVVVVTETSEISVDGRAKACKFIVSRVDLSDYYAKVEKQKVIDEIERELDDQLRKVQRYEMFKMCAKTSPKMQELLGRLNQLDPSTNLIEQVGEEVTK